MTTTMDRRIAHRRDTVREDGARRRLRRLLVAIVVAALLGTAGWVVYQSPYLRVREISIVGASRSAATDVVAATGLVPGMPAVNVRTGQLEAALESDPWVAAARVRVTWPDTVEIAVVEHHPNAWVATGAGWMLVSGTGFVLESAEEAGEELPRIRVGSVATEPGSSVDEAARAALSFVSALPPHLSSSATVEGTIDALTGTVGGHPVLLGYGSDMEEKAAALVSVLGAGLPPGSTVSVVSPRRPAVDPEPEVETSVLILGEDT